MVYIPPVPCTKLTAGSETIPARVRLPTGVPAGVVGIRIINESFSLLSAPSSSSLLPTVMFTRTFCPSSVSTVSPSPDGLSATANTLTGNGWLSRSSPIMIESTTVMVRVNSSSELAGAVRLRVSKIERTIAGSVLVMFTENDGEFTSLEIKPP